MKMFIISSALLILALGIFACNGSSTSTIDRNLSYDYIENGCDTQTQTFNSYSDLCNGLQNNSLNHNCAMDLRKADFADNCAGQTFAAF